MHHQCNNLSQFFGQDFTTERWKKAALKNAFALLSKQRFHPAKMSTHTHCKYHLGLLETIPVAVVHPRDFSSSIHCFCTAAYVHMFPGVCMVVWWECCVANALQPLAVLRRLTVRQLLWIAMGKSMLMLCTCSMCTGTAPPHLSTGNLCYWECEEGSVRRAV